MIADVPPDDAPERARRIGRPPLADGDRSASVSVRLPGREVNALYVAAHRQRLSVAELVRKLIRASHDRDRT